MGYNNIKHENAHSPWHPGCLLGLLTSITVCGHTYNQSGLVCSFGDLSCQFVLSCVGSVHELMSCMRGFAIASSGVVCIALSQVFVFERSIGDYSPGFSFGGIPARSLAVPCIEQTSKSPWCVTAEVPIRDSAGGRLVIGAKTLTTRNYLTPQCVVARIACDRTKSYQSLLLRKSR